MTSVKAKPVPDRASPWYGKRFGLRHLLFAVVVAALALAALIQFGWVLILVGLIALGVLVALSLVVVLLRRREVEQEALLRFLSIAADRRMPLAPGIEACAELCSVGYRQRALGLAYLLETGVPLPVALDTVPNLLPRSALVLISVGWSLGCLAPSLREADAADRARRSFRLGFIPKLAYLAGVLLAMELILGFIFYFVIPKFEAIFNDFGTALPELTQVSIRISHAMIDTGLLPLLILGELSILAYGVLAYFGLVSWEAPPIPWLLRRRDNADVLRTLAVGIEGDRPIGSILTVLARVHPRNRVRKRLNRAVARIEGGQPWISTLHAEGLITGADPGVLDAAERAGNLAWALRTLADSHDRRLSYRLATLSQALFPALVLALALIVGFFVISLFLPLVQLIDQLAGVPR